MRHDRVRHDRLRQLAQPIATGVVACVTGFASSFVIVVAGLQAVGATEAQAASGLMALCLVGGICNILLPLWLRIPVSTAWSTPGAALLVAGHASDRFDAAVGAFLLCGALTVLAGLWPALGRLVARIPAPIANAMLAGILLPICLAPIEALVQQPLLAAPIVILWLVLLRVASRWATPAAMLLACILIVVNAAPGWMPANALPQLSLVVPAFDPLVLVSVGIPLWIVTMAGQNVPGLAIMQTLDYPVPPRAALVSTGAATMLVAPFGGHALNLAAITAALMAGEEAGRRDRRWIAVVSCGVAYLVLAVLSTIVTSLIGAAPPILITAVAGLALIMSFANATSLALAVPDQRLTAAVTFLVTASGVSIVGIGSALWGLLAGVVVLWLMRSGSGWRARSG